MATALSDPRVRNGLTYPFGAIEPGVPVELAPGLSILRIAVPGPLRHVNCYLLADGEYSHVSSTLIKQLAQFGGDQALSRFVPAALVEPIMSKIQSYTG